MKLSIIILSLALTACATKPHSPIIDSAGPNYSNDLAACQQYAEQLPSTADSALTGAVAGAIFSALLGAAFHVSSRDMAWGGALGGAAGSAARSEQEQRNVVSRCLQGRGYRVLN